MNFSTFSTKKDDATLTVTLNYGDVNMMSATMVAELFSLVGQLTIDTSTRVVVFESANTDFFVAHFDINDILKLIDGDPTIPVSKSKDLNILQALGLSLNSLPQVTIAKVDGICRGGGFEMMLAMDMCFATEHSKFCFPEVSAGFLPSGGGSTLLPLKVGSARALEIMLTARDFSGAEAGLYNVVNKVFSNSEQLDDYVKSTVAYMSTNSLASIQGVKSVLKQTMSGFKNGLFSGLAQENTVMEQCFSNPKTIQTLRLLADNTGAVEQELELVNTIRTLVN
ncbi:enoyl-CoA hydratase/isomerase family protein [Thalassotalea nanhaiensis]|uniref:Enoyl-CoA hydratase/isomerase family protein n=1 Tax=Thalassotalea nanhaiensis TaxID=3065648 RepID=A0ABY9TN98_9GAMM|nr:enoyl-CoA hydratase/isomerase family protein [Colwelliaceae bacterium SQ345]